MSRQTRNTVILALIESVYATDPVPAAANAMLTSKPTINPLNAQNVPRDVLLGYLGNKEHLVGTRFVECTFDVEIDAGGTAGTRPAFGDLLIACGLAEAATVGTRVDYTPVSTGFGSATIYWYDDGVLHKLTGARGDVSFKLVEGGIPVMSFSFKGLYTTPSAAANALTTGIANFKTPQVVSPFNTGNLTFGGTHSSSGAPAIAAGTTYPSQGIEVMLANSVNYVALLGGEEIDITQRDPSCKFSVDLTAAQEVTFMSAVESAALTTVGIVHGTAAGHKSLIWLPFVQRISPTKQDVSGKRLVGFEGRVTPSAGNDEMRLVFF